MRVQGVRLISFQVQAMGPATSNREAGEREGHDSNGTQDGLLRLEAIADTIPDCSPLPGLSTVVLDF
jgi:hypothetical protein